MKPVLHILALGWESFDSISLRAFRLLSKADQVLVMTLNHPMISSLLKEGIHCEEIIPDYDIVNHDQDYDIEEIILFFEKRKLFPDGSENVLVLLGNSLPEWKLVTKLQETFSGDIRIETSTLIPRNSIEKLKEIMAVLRSDRGCPWDREQDHMTLKKYLIEEAYEVIEAIDSQNMNNFCEELGDLLLQVVFHARIAEESGEFNLTDVIEGISDKLIRRHPHVFSTAVAECSEEVVINWDTIKNREKSKTSEEQSFFNTPKGLPALFFAQHTQKEAGKVGFDWDNYHGPLAKIHEELLELTKEIEGEGKVKEEMGDILFSIVNLARFLEIDAEDALRQGTRKFQERFNEMAKIIASENRILNKMTSEEMDIYWDIVKNKKKMVL